MNTGNPIFDARKRAYLYLTGDFRSLWSAMVEVQETKPDRHRGNYAFATILTQIAEIGLSVDILTQISEHTPAYGPLFAHWGIGEIECRGVVTYEFLDRPEYAFNGPVPSRPLNGLRYAGHLQPLGDGAILCDARTMFIDLTDVLDKVFLEE